MSFNKYIKENVQELAAAGETTMDLLVNLFNGYREAKDKPFWDFNTRTEDDWLFRCITLAKDGLALTELTSNYYKDHVKWGLWLQSDETQETILALKALQQQHGTYRRNPTNKPNRLDSRPKKQDKDWKTKPPAKVNQQKSPSPSRSRSTPTTGALITARRRFIHPRTAY